MSDPQQPQHTVLVVEDDDDIRESLRDLLRSEGFEVIAVPSLVEARGTLDSRRIDTNPARSEARRRAGRDAAR